MPLQNFKPNSLPAIGAAWLNKIDAFVTTLFREATTPTQALEALGIASQPTYRNKLINGNTTTAQFANAVTTSGYICDGWLAGASASPGTYTGLRVVDTGPTELGFPNFLRLQSGAANAAATGSFWLLNQKVTGATIADLAFGTPGAVPATLSFYARTSVPGQYGVFMRNHNASRSYVAPVTLTSSWARYSTTIPGDTGGTWLLNTNNLGADVGICAGVGTTFGTTTPLAWGSGNFVGIQGQANAMGTNGATFDMTGVQLERGVITTPFEVLPQQLELMRAQFFYETMHFIDIGFEASAPITIARSMPERVTKRATPNTTLVQVFNTTNISAANFGYQALGPLYIVLTVGGTGTYHYQVTFGLDARL